MQDQLDDAILEPQLKDLAIRYASMSYREIVQHAISSQPMPEVIQAMTREVMNQLDFERSFLLRKFIF